MGAIADAIGKNVGKLKPQVIRKDEKGMVIKNDYIARLLSLRPCPEMSTYDFLYRIAVDLVYTSNSFSVIFWNKDFTRVESIQPITTTSYRIFEDDKNNILFRFRWDYDGKTYTVPYQNVIHVKARYNKRRFLGTTPDMELKRSLDLIETSGETIKNIVNRSNSLAGYLKYNNIADDEELKEIARNFQDAYMNKDNAGGIAAIDNTVEFKEISQRTPSIPTNQITFLRDNIYRYYGVNDKILTSTLNDTEFISFYENVIEPISVQLSYEFTFKLLTPREIGYGNRIDFVANLLQYATLQTRETIGGGMFDRGALTINEYRELMYYGPVEDGDQRLVATWFLTMFTNAYTNVTNVFAAIGSWFGARWTEIKTALASVPTWFKTQFDNAWTNIKNAFANVTSFFSDLWEKIKGCFVNVGVAIGSAVGDAFKSAINSCLSTIEGVVNKFIGMINGVIGIINEIPGVSLSKIDTLSLPRLAKGGVLREGTAMVAEAGPELLSMVNGKAVVTPLTGSAVNTAADNLKGNNSGFHQEINITSPKALSPYEVARQTRIQTRAMVIAMQRG